VRSGGTLLPSSDCLVGKKAGAHEAWLQRNSFNLSVAHHSPCSSENVLSTTSGRSCNYRAILCEVGGAPHPISGGTRNFVILCCSNCLRMFCARRGKSGWLCQ
jgi:hypothetical protein